MNVPQASVIPLGIENQRDGSEGTLVERAQRGDELAFATLYQLHNKRVYSVCLRMTKDVAEAEDLAQEAFMQVFRNLNSFRGNSAFATWLYRIAVNTVLMEIGAAEKPVLMVFNKIDHVTGGIPPLMREKYPHAVSISAKTGEGVAPLLAELGTQLRPIREFLDLRVPHDPFVPGNQAGFVTLELRTFPSGIQHPARDVAEAGTNDHAIPAGLATSEADFHFASPSERFVGRMRREGLPIARLWKSESALLSIGLNKRGKPGVWFTKTLH